ncbi:class I SAM-dependent methyltransferase [Thioalkalivibrio thiocyanoxidans]|uniref:class I SAM-dependent methyltransferase n=1 Tax=Thioalkalivibrio thiocyanoxidans TaxID=152475 RepID=UPI00037F356F|nr:class I SAM-dependent methyltransferase [Thioalkalivibrio thiocyanoxidans]
MEEYQNDLERLFFENTGRLIHKWRHYFEIYDRHFSRFRGTDVHVVEFGVSQGGSLQMWKEYFGPKAKIVGIDVNPNCKALEEDQVEILIGDQEDRRFLDSVKERIPRIDILIDDGGHTMAQQINTFEELFPAIDSNGVYLCEDLHTSYWRKWGGGYGRAGSFIEYSKNFVDLLHAWHSEDEARLAVTDFTSSVHSLHYYDSILVIEKRPVEKPFHLKTGVATIPAYQGRRSGPEASTTSGLTSHDGALVGRRVEALERELVKCQDTNKAIRKRLLDAQRRIQAFRSSASWRFTAPVRHLMRGLRNAGGRLVARK